MHNRIRKLIALSQLASAGAAAIALGMQLLEPGRLGTDAAWPAAFVVALCVLGGVAGSTLWDDRPNGALWSLAFLTFQIPVVALVGGWRFHTVLGPYLLVVAGEQGAWAGLGFSFGFAPITALSHAPPWAGLNLLALAAAWYVWQSPWRASRTRGEDRLSEIGAPAAAAAAVPPASVEQAP